MDTPPVTVRVIDVSAKVKIAHPGLFTELPKSYKHYFYSCQFIIFVDNSQLLHQKRDRSMLLEFSVENFRSFKRKQTLSMISSSDKFARESNTFSIPNENATRVNASTIIYGANASGKSNLMKAMAFVETFVWTSATKTQEGSKIPVAPFKLDPVTAVKPSSFEVTFIEGETRYIYSISVDKDRVHFESLAAFPKGRRQLWYLREYNYETGNITWKMGPELKGERERIKGFVRENSLYLSHAAQNNHPQLTPVFKWFSERFANLIFPEISKNWTAEMCGKDPEFCKLILDFLAAADAGIDHIVTEEVKFDENILDILSDTAKNEILKDIANSTITRVKTVHKGIDNLDVLFDLDDESDGTQRLFQVAGPCLDVMRKGMTLYIDELDRSLHAKLTRHIISMFHNNELNSHHAQLICTSHDVSLLDQQTLFRRDQIWFVEKDRDGSSVLYPLSEFSPRKDESLQKGYLLGRYGAIPFIDEGSIKK
jgi:hypothetical protein